MFDILTPATGLERFEVEKIKSFFVKFDLLEKGFIMKYEVDDVLKSKSFNTSKKQKRNNHMGYIYFKLISDDLYL